MALKVFIYIKGISRSLSSFILFKNSRIISLSLSYKKITNSYDKILWHQVITSTAELVCPWILPISNLYTNLCIIFVAQALMPTLCRNDLQIRCTENNYIFFYRFSFNMTALIGTKTKGATSLQDAQCTGAAYGCSPTSVSVSDDQSPSMSCCREGGQEALCSKCFRV